MLFENLALPYNFELIKYSLGHHKKPTTLAKELTSYVIIILS